MTAEELAKKLLELPELERNKPLVIWQNNHWFKEIDTLRVDPVFGACVECHGHPIKWEPGM